MAVRQNAFVPLIEALFSTAQRGQKLDTPYIIEGEGIKVRGLNAWPWIPSNKQRIQAAKSFVRSTLQITPLKEVLCRMYILSLDLSPLDEVL
jgi:hypothetical protein